MVRLGQVLVLTEIKPRKIKANNVKEDECDLLSVVYIEIITGYNILRYSVIETNLLNENM